MAMKILLIDDEALVRDELGGLLQEEGYQVVTGADGEDGLALFRSARPDMVITDIRMPRRDGLSVAVTIRREDPSVPVTVITGHGSEAMVIDALRAGVTDFVKKPVRFEDLAAALARMEAARRPALGAAAELPSGVQLVEQAWTYQLGNDPAAIPGVLDHLARGWGTRTSHAALVELSLALRELLQNAVEHGNLGISYDEKSGALEAGALRDLLAERAAQPPYSTRRVTMAIQRLPRRVVASIIDEGEGFDWRRLPDPTDSPNLLRAHGRGILLARMYVDVLEFNAQGNQVTVEKAI